MDKAMTIVSIAVTVAIYAGSRRLFVKRPSALLNPMFLSTTAIIALLATSGARFEDYRQAKEVMTSLLGPATIALAVPLYRQRHVLRAKLPVVLAGVVSGSLSTVITVVLVGRAAALDETIVRSLAPKSVTAPIAVEIAGVVGGDPTLAAGFVIATGLLGSMVGPGFLSLIGVRDAVARGLAIGTTSHGQGTAIILHEGETQRAMSGVAMALAAVFTAIVAPIVVPWLIGSAAGGG
jgi:predicted murein hydrolase (TIGR00659 family)